MNGPLSPYARRLGVVALTDGPEDARYRLDYGPEVAGRPGFFHGGALGGLLEAAALGALIAALEERDGGAEQVTAQPLSRFAPINFTIDFMRGAGEVSVFAAAEVLRLGRSLANVEAVAWTDARSRPVATARAHFLLR